MLINNGPHAANDGLNGAVRMPNPIIRPTRELTSCLSADEQCSAVNRDVHIPLEEFQASPERPTLKHIVIYLHTSGWVSEVED